MVKRPKVSVIIIFYNDIKVTERCLKSFLRTDYPDIEVILVDNNSSDGSFEYFKKKYPKLKIIHNKINDYAGGYNLGAKYALGEWLFFTMNDIEAKKDWLKNLIFDEKIVCQPKLMDYYNRTLVQGFGGRYIYPGIARGVTIGSNENREVDYCQAETFINKKLFNRIGGFDKRFVTNYEECDLSLKAKRSGAKCFVCGKSIVYHIGGYSTRRADVSDIITYYMHRNAILTIKNNFFGIDRTMRLFFLMTLEIIHFLVLLLTLNFKKVGILIKAIRGANE